MYLVISIQILTFAYEYKRIFSDEYRKIIALLRRNKCTTVLPPLFVFLFVLYTNCKANYERERTKM